MRRNFPFLVSFFCLIAVDLLAADVGPLEYDRDIRPILAENCFACHGPSESDRQADLRFDQRQGATADLGGYQAIVPGDASSSALVERIVAEEDYMRMPPPDSGKELSADQIEQLKQWIDQGAIYDQHWSFRARSRPSVPEVVDASWPRNAIDQFALRRLEQEGLEPSPPADPRTLIRRLYFDLTGLPPTDRQVDLFCDDNTSRKYELLVDQLIDSPHYGEQMAMYWLDLVRYADTVGYHGDQPMPVSAYRDYVINAFNDDMPFDQFTREQLAGDLLPKPNAWQKIATAYNRLNQKTAEGGAQDKEYLAIYQADRIRNVSEVWLGLTMGCCQCHDHKFDPLSSRDFYSFGAFFADIKQKGFYANANATGGWGTSMRVPDEERDRKLHAIDAQVASLKASLKQQSEQLTEEQLAWEKSQSQRLAQAEAAGDQNGIDDQQIPAGEQSGSSLSPELRAALASAPEQRSAEQAALLASHFRTIAPQLVRIREKIAQLETSRQELLDAARRCLITEPTEPMTVRVLPRGNWMDESGDIVQPAIPEVFGQVKQQQKRATRLDLANWIVDRENPLTARVFVNRLWYRFFGRGISNSLDDFGTQGDFPTHPELLDWLASEFVDSGWSVKHVVRLIVSSAAYRQSSDADAAQRRQDPFNARLARQGRFRLPAEVIRDNALSVGGLLVETIGGQSVKPYQPAGYWQHLNFPKRTYQRSQGEALWRRSIYTHWQRTFLHPSLRAFDAPSREECTAARPRSNTPLQALVLLNDPIFVEAARGLAQRMLKAGGDSDASRIQFAYQAVLQRSPSEVEASALLKYYQAELRYYAQHSEAAKQLSRVGQLPVVGAPEGNQLAAATAVARVLLNLHETITRY